MGEISIERKFHASVLLVGHHLRNRAESTDLEEQLAFALENRMFREQDVAFFRRCLELDEKLQQGSADEEIGEELVKELQACAMRLNAVEAA